ASWSASRDLRCASGNEAATTSCARFSGTSTSRPRRRSSFAKIVALLATSSCRAPKRCAARESSTSASSLDVTCLPTVAVPSARLSRSSAMNLTSAGVSRYRARSLTAHVPERACPGLGVPEVDRLRELAVGILGGDQNALGHKAVESREPVGDEVGNGPVVVGHDQSLTVLHAFQHGAQVLAQLSDPNRLRHVH